MPLKFSLEENKPVEAPLPIGDRGEEPLNFDPRPDLTEDSALWDKLLMHTRAIDGNDPNGLYGALDGIRCCGARLYLDGDTLKIDGSECSAPDGRTYVGLRQQYLIKHADKLRRILREQGQWEIRLASQTPCTERLLR